MKDSENRNADSAALHLNRLWNHTKHVEPFVDQYLSLQSSDDKVTFLASLSVEDAIAVVDFASTVETMQMETVRLPVPEALLAVVERSLKTQPVTATTSLFVKATEAGLQVMESFLNGMQVKTEQQAITRRADINEEILKNRLIFSQKIGRGNLSLIMTGSGENEVQVDVVLEAMAGRYSVELKKEDRTIAIASLGDAGKRRQASFDRLNPGPYQLDIQGHYPRFIQFTIL